MKKILLGLAIATGMTSFNANAQLALENFNAGVLPTGWYEITDGHTVSPSFASGDPTIAARLDDSAFINYPLTSATDLGMLTTSYFSTPATADRWIITPSFNVSAANTVIQWDDNDLGSGENIEVWVSPTAGTTAASFTTMIYSAPCTPGGAFGTHQAVIPPALVGTNVRVAFRDHTNDNWGFGLDNVKSAILPHSLDMGVTSLNLPSFLQTGVPHTFTGVMHNYGGTTIISTHLNYSISGGAPVMTPLTGLSIVGVSDYNYTCATPWNPPAAGSYTIKLWNDNLNGSGADENNAWIFTICRGITYRRQ